GRPGVGGAASPRRRHVRSRHRGSRRPRAGNFIARDRGDRAAALAFVEKRVARGSGGRAARDLGGLRQLGVGKRRNRIIAVHAAGAAIVARSGGEWYGVDRESRYRRAWSPWHGEIDLETWPHDTRTVGLVASVRSLAPIVLTVRQDDAVVWRNTILPSFPR